MLHIPKAFFVLYIVYYNISENNFNTVVAPNTSTPPIASIPIPFLMSAFWSADANMYLTPANTTAAIANIWTILAIVAQRFPAAVTISVEAVPEEQKLEHLLQTH